MTRQEIYNKVKAHLLTQNQQSMRTFEYGDGCAYRSENGLSCAIGCLIPDDLYNAGIEGSDVHGLLDNYDGEFDFLRPTDHVESSCCFLEYLQNIHDKYPVEEWEQRLTKFAKTYKLIP